MKNVYDGSVIIRVTANGCGLPLYGAKLYIDGKVFTIPSESHGFSERIKIFQSDRKGISCFISARAECNGFESLTCNKIPVTSGYITLWNMPLEPKVRQSQIF